MTATHSILGRVRAPETQETRALRGASEAWREDQVERGGRALGVVRESLPVLRGALMDERIPAGWRARLQALADRMDWALVGRR